MKRNFSATTPVIENWYYTNGWSEVDPNVVPNFRIVGVRKNHPGFNDGAPIVTDEIVTMAPDESFAITASSFFVMGRKKKKSVFERIFRKNSIGMKW